MAEGKKTFDDPVTVEEVAEVAARLGEAEPTPEVAGAPQAPEAAPAEAAAPPAEPGAEEKPAAPPQAEPGQFVELGGKKYTADDIVELQRAGLLQSDYTRKTQLLQEERRLLDERASIQAEREAMLESFERGATGEPGEGEEPTEAEKEELSPAELRQLRDEVRQIRSYLSESRSDRNAEKIWSIYERTLAELDEKYHMPELLRPLVASMVEKLNPAVADGDGNPFAEQQIRDNVSRAYLDVYKPLHPVVQQLSAPKPAPTTTPRGRVAVPPAGGPAPAPAASSAGPGKPTWNNNEAVLEFMQRMSQEPPSQE